MIWRRVIAAPITLSAILLCAPQAHPQAREGADILIVENVRFLHLVDRYQQTVQNPADVGIRPFVPMRILEPNDLLGDGLTACIRVEVERHLFFLLKDANGDLEGAGQLGFHTIFRGAKLLHDTLQVVLHEGLILRNPAGGSAITLVRGTRIACVFEHAGRTYVHALDPSGAYGWVEGSATAGTSRWQHEESLPIRGTTFTSTLMPRVEATLQEVNTVYEELYRVLNAQTGRNEPVPRWTATTADSAIICVLETAVPPEAASRSSALLAKRLESLILGTTLRINSAPGRIEILP